MGSCLRFLSSIYCTVLGLPIVMRLIGMIPVDTDRQYEVFIKV